jgi:hypothetical protein
MGGACSIYAGEEMCMSVSVGKPEGTRPLGKPRSRWSNKVIIVIQEIGWSGMY